MIKKSFRQRLKEALALALTGAILISGIPLAALADNGSSEQSGNAFVIRLNGSDASAANALSVACGDPAVPTLDGYSGTAEPEFIWLSAAETPGPEAQWTKWAVSAPAEPGSYFIGYEFTDSEGRTYSRYDGSYRFTITKSQAAVPSEVKWENGSTASWSAVTANTAGNTLASGAVSGYRLALYRGGAAVGTYTTAAVSYDFTDLIKAGGKGSYTFTVQTTVSDKTRCLDSAVSSASAAETAALVTVNAGEGAASASPASKLLIAGNTGENSLEITAVLKNGRVFSGWSADPEAAVTFASASSLKTTVTLNSGYLGGTDVAVTASTTDTGSPEITFYGAGTGSEYGTLKASASDAGSAIVSYAFSTAADASGVGADEWRTAPENGAGISAALTYSVAASGTYYLYVRDAFGNTARSAAGIRATEVKYSGYYENGTADGTRRDFIVGGAALVLDTPSRPGYSSAGWHLDPACGDAAVTELSAHSASAITVYTTWTREPINILAQPQDYTGEYDGTSHTLSVSVGNTAGTISYQWYKTIGGDNQKIDGAAGAEYSVKNVADSGTYSVQVTITLDGSSASTFSTAAAVSITAKALALTADDRTLTYGDAVPENFYTFAASGFAAGDDRSVLTAGTVSCSYDPADAANSAAGKYAITMSGFSAANYTVVCTGASLIVSPKNGVTGAGMTSSLARTEWNYTGSEIRPAVTAADGTKTLTEGTDYTVAYSGNVNVGTAEAAVTFRGNYTGSAELVFHIERASFSADVLLDSWTYGEKANTPALSTNNSGGAVSYYYYGENQTAADAAETVPAQAGSYRVFAVIAATDNYMQVTTAAREFQIEKRIITLTANDGFWVYDGNSHANASYSRTGTFSGADGFLWVNVTGSILNVGRTDNTVTYALTSATNAGNYDIRTISGSLKVAQRKLTVPTGCVWDGSAPGTASWVALTRDNLEVGYAVSLYRISGDGTGNTLVASVTTGTCSHDFSSAIREDSQTNGVAGYCFTVAASPSGGSSADNYAAGAASDNSAALYTASVTVSGGTGIDSAAINGAAAAVLLEGETFTLRAAVRTGYSFSGTVWSETSGNVVFKDAKLPSATAMLSAGLTKAETLFVAASCGDDVPVITGFSASAYQNNSMIRFTLSAADTRGIIAWAITNSGTEAPSDSEWHSTGEAVAALDGQTLDGITAEGTYYAWVKDDGGNVVCSSSGTEGIRSIDVYRIAFAAGDQGAGTMAPILKVENKAVTLPAAAFSRSGFNFRNWNGVSGIYANGGSYTANSSDTLTAQWTDQQFAYTVNYYLMDVSGSYGAQPDQTLQYTGGYGEVVTSADAGLSFTGMTLDASKAESITLTADGFVLNVYYQRQQYTVTYSWTTPDGIEKKTVQTCYYGAPVTEAEKPAADGYAFVGWVYGGSGKAPATMPADNLTASGSFLPADASYTIHYYEQNIPVNAWDAATYTLVASMDKTVAARQGDKVTVSTAGAEKIEGFTAACVTVSLGGAGGSVPSGSSASASGTVSRDAGSALNINYYCTRNVYALTLNVYDSSLRTNRIYTYSENRLYGETIDAAEFASVNQAQWTGSQAGTVLADYADWSTGEAPSRMPAGDVTVARDYIKAVEAPYNVEIYYETAQEGVYQRQVSLTYYGYVSSTVTIGSTDDFTVNYTDFSGSIYEFDYYTFSSGNAENVVSASVRADGTTTLKAYFERKTVSSTITYYYNTGLTESGAATSNVKLATVTKSGKWGSSYTYEPLALFSGSGLPASYTAFDAEKAGVYDFRANGYMVSYSGYYVLDGGRHWPGRVYTTAAMLTDNAGDGGVFGQESNSISVYYVLCSRDTHYTVDMAYNPRNLAKSGDTSNHALTAEVNGTRYQVRIANKADVFESTWVSSVSAEDAAAYPALAEIRGSYSYGDAETLRPGFSAVTVDGSVYYLNAAEPGYLYVIDARNQFYYGSRVSYNFLADSLNAAKVGYASVEAYLAAYQAAHSDSSNAGTYDARSQGAYIYNGGFSPIMYGSGIYQFTFDYADIYTVTYTMNGNSCSDHTYVKNQQVTVGCGDKTLFPDKDGYSVVWYADTSYTTKAQDFSITKNTTLYGRYEKNTISYKICNYYELPDSESFITDPGTAGLTSETSSVPFSFTDGGGNSVASSVSTTKYYSGGVLVMAVSEIPCLTFTEVTLNYAAYLTDGFTYDSANSSNAVKGFCETSGISLSSYYVRNKNTVTVNLKNAKVDNDVTTVYRVGQNVTLQKPEKTGYSFAGWVWTQWNGTEWTAWDGAPAAEAEGSVSFRMPELDIRAEASWTAAEYPSTIVHYFQTAARTYETERYAQLSAMQNPVPAAITFGGVSYSGSVYGSGGSITGASLVLNGKTWYFSSAAKTADGYSAEVNDLIVVAESAAELSDTTFTVSDKELDLTAYPMFGFAFAVYQDGTDVQNLAASGTFVYGPDTSISYYYSRTSNYTVTLAAASADGGADGLTLVGGGTYCYGESVTVRASASAGYTFLGWYLASDTAYVSPVSTDLQYTFLTTESKSLVALSRPAAAAAPTVTLGGKSAYSYGYAASKDNAVTASITFGTGTDTANKVASYQWYSVSGGVRTAIADETSSAYNIPTGLACGTYTCQCDVTVTRNDNGRSVTVSSNLFAVTVAPAEMTVKVDAYEGTYDGSAHGITVDVKKPAAGNFEIYYAAAELTAANYKTAGSTVNPVYTNVVMNGASVGSYTVYYYIHNTDGNYNDMASSAPVTIRPVGVTMKAAGSYHRTYDGTTAVGGSVVEAGTGKYLLSRGTSYTMSGLLEGDQDLYIADFDAVFDSSNVDSASSVTLSSLKIVSKADGKVNNNYSFDSGYSLVVSGYITPYALNTSWDDTVSFLYDGTPKVPGIHVNSASAIPDAAVADNLVVQGSQISAGSYTAYASLAENAAYKTSNYSIQNSSCSYTITRRAITVTPVAPADGTVIYDGEAHEIREFAVGGSGLAVVNGTAHTCTAETDRKAAAAGATPVTAKNVRVYQSGTDVTDNYAITCGTVNFVLGRRTVTVSGFTADDKTYDGSTSAAVHTGSLTFTGIVGSDSLSIAESAVSGTFDTAAAGTGKTVTVALDAEDLGGASAANYTLNTAGSDCTAAADIKKAVITVSGVPASVVYGENAVFQTTYSGFVSGEDQSVVSGSVVFRVKAGSSVSGYTVRTAAGSYDILPDVSGLSAANYSFAPSETAAVLTVEKRPLAAAASADPSVTKTYDGTDAATMFVGSDDWTFAAVEGNSVSGIVNGDQVSLGFTAVYDGSDVSDQRIVTVSGLSVGSANYALQTESFTIPGCSITKRALTVTAANASVTYGAAAAPAYTVSYSGFVSGESAASLGGTLAISCAFDPQDAANRNAGTYGITASGYTSGNYQITFVPGELTVKKAVVTVTAKAETITYGMPDSVPAYSSSYSGFRYGDGASVVSGTPAVSCSKTYLDTAGVYAGAIAPDISGLSAGNYTFSAVSAALTIEKHELTVSGVTVGPKTYDGTKSVSAAQIQTGSAVYDGILPGDVSDQGLKVTAQYASPDAGSGIGVTLQISLNDYLAKRYSITAGSQSTAAADITQKTLNVAVDSRQIVYGAAEPSYTVQYSGFVSGETSAVLKGTLTFAETYTADPVSGTYSPAGTYPVTADGYDQSGNYRITYTAGTLTVSAAKLAETTASWSSVPGTAVWTAVSGVGAVRVGGYTVELVETGTGKIVKTVSAAADAASCDFLETMRANGAGSYQVKVTAAASETDNAGKANVADSAAAVTGIRKAAKVSVKFAGDADSQAAGVSAAIGGGTSPSYVMIAGESGAAIQAVLKNATGYTVASLVSDSSALTVASPVLDVTGTAVNSSASLSASPASAADITVTLAMTARPATLSVNISADPAAAVFGYTASSAPVLSVSAGPEGTDNLTDAAGYTYTYQWYLKEGASGTNTAMENGTGSTVTFPTGKNAADNKYWVTCQVTATRKDNGMQKVITAQSQLSAKTYYNIVITRAPFTSEVSLSGWTYGQTRNQPSVSSNPGNGAVRYEYNSTSAEAQDGWTTVVPKDAGTYYLRAYIAQTINYKEFLTPVVSFTIGEDTLAVPAGLEMGESAMAPYGQLSWSAVSGPKENNGVSPDSAVAVSYRIKLYRADTAGAADADWTLVKMSETSETTLDVTSEITQKGYYRFTAAALAACSNGKANCADSAESARSDAVLEIGSDMNNGQSGYRYEKVYDGTAITLNAGNNLESVSCQWLCDKKEVAGATSAALDLTFVEQSGTYTCRLTSGTGSVSYSTNHVVSITPRTVVITSRTQSKVYDGTPLSGEVQSVTELGTGDTAAYTLAGITDAGETPNAITGVTITHNQGAAGEKIVFQEGGASNSYTLTKTAGTLTVSPRSLSDGSAYNTGITVTQPAAETYNGSVHTPAVTITDATITVGGSGKVLAAGTDYSAAYSNHLHAGTASVTITGKGNYSGVIVRNFSIVQKDVSLTAGSKTREYNGSPLTDHTCSVAAGSSLAAGDSIDAASVTCSGTITDIGTADNEITAVIIRNSSRADVTGDYSISKNKGTLTVSKVSKAITVTANSKSKTYDGAALTDGGYTFTQNVLISGDILTAVITGSQTDAGSSENTVDSYKVTRGTTDVTEDYTFAADVSGTLTVKKRSVTLTSASQTREYSGQPLTNSTVTATGDGWANGEGASCSVTGSQLDAGSSANVFTYTLNEKTKAANYTIETTEGTLTVSAVSAPITITANSKSKTYDGTALTDGGCTYTQDVLISGDILTAEIAGSQTDAGSSANSVASYKVTRGTTDVTKNYTFEAGVSGTLTVAKRSVTLTSASQTREYSGQPLTNSTVTATGDGWASGEGAAYTVTGSQLDAGSSANVFTYTLNEKTKAANYTITKTEGTLTVSVVSTPITITANSGSKTYDGTALTDSGYTFTQNVLISGDVLTAVITGSQTDAGSSANTVASYKVTRGTTDVTADYTFAADVSGTLTVAKRSVTLTSASQTREYSGQPLTNSTVTATGDGWASGEGAAYTVTGSQLDAGSSANVFTYTLNAGTKAANYTIAAAEGTLTVSAVSAPITITANSKSKTYDGTALTDSGYTFTQNVLISGDVLTAVITGSQTDAGSSANTVASYKVTRGTADVTMDYTFTADVPGMLTVAKRSVTLTSATQEREYSGQPLTNSTVTATGDGWANGEGASCSVTGSQLDAGSSANVFTYTLNAGTKAANYTITTTEGTLTVSKVSKAITVTSNSGSKTYDGTALTDSGYTFTQNVLISGDILTAVITGSQTDAGSSANTVASYKVTRGTADVTANYTFAADVPGTLRVDQAAGAVSVASARLDKVYDGRPAASPEIRQTGDGAVTFEYSQVTGTAVRKLSDAPKDAGTYRVKAVAAASRDYTGAESALLEFTIAPRPITITAADARSSYGAQPAVLDAAVTSANKVCEGDDLHIGAASAAASASPVGVYRITPVYDKNPNYEITGKDGVYTVDSAALPYAVSGYLGDYDGSAHGLAVSGPEGMKVYYSETELTAANYLTEGRPDLKYTEAGTHEVCYYITMANYLPVSGSAAVTVSRAVQTVTAGNVTAEYDGAVHSVTASANGGTVSYENNDKTEAGTYAVTVRASGAENYADAETTATITITRRGLTITAGSASKPYDGTPLASGEYSVTAGSLAGTDRIAGVTMKGGVTEVGTGANTIAAVTILDASGRNVTESYDLTLVGGTLEVTAAAGSAEIPAEDVAGTKTFDYGSGHIIVIVEDFDTDGNQTEGTFVSSESVVRNCLTQKELETAANGEDIEIRLIVTRQPEKVDEDDLQNQKLITREITDNADGKNLKMGMFIDLDLEKRVGSADWQQLKELSEDLDITIDVPEKLQMGGCKYYVARAHGGDYTLLADLDGDAETITFRTNLFSSYAILYQAAEKGNFVLFNLAAMLASLILAVICMAKKKKRRIAVLAAAVLSAVLYVLLFEQGTLVLFNLWSILFGAVLALEIVLCSVRDKDREESGNPAAGV